MNAIRFFVIATIAIASAGCASQVSIPTRVLPQQQATGYAGYNQQPVVFAAKPGAYNGFQHPYQHLVGVPVGTVAPGYYAASTVGVHPTTFGTSAPPGYNPARRQSALGNGARAYAQIDELLPEQAAQKLAELRPIQAEICSGRATWQSAGVGALIGGVLMGIITQDVRWAAAGAGIGAGAGSSNAKSDCQRVTDAIDYYQRIVAHNSCDGQVRQKNGVVTDDEVCNFRRGYKPQHATPQIADRTAALPKSVPPAPIYHRPVEEEKPPK